MQNSYAIRLPACATVVADREAPVATERLGEIIKRLRTERGLTQGQLATYANVTRSWLSRVELGHRPRPEREMLERVAVVLRVPAETLLAAAGYRVGPIPETHPLSSEELARELLATLEREKKGLTSRPLGGRSVILLKVAESFLAAGEGALALGEVPYIPEPGTEAHRYTPLLVKGTCMEPAIHDGEIAIVDHDREPQYGDIVGVTHDGEALIRILRGEWLESLNGHPPLRMDERTRVEGVVVHVGMWRRPILP